MENTGRKYENIKYSVSDTPKKPYFIFLFHFNFQL